MTMCFEILGRPPIMRPIPKPEPQLDDADWRGEALIRTRRKTGRRSQNTADADNAFRQSILDMLQDGPKHTPEIAKQLRCSNEKAYKVLAKLQDNGVVTGQTVQRFSGRLWRLAA